MTALKFLVAVLTCPAHTSRLVGPDVCASSLIRPFPRVPPFGVRVSGGLVVGRLGGFAWGLWAFPWGGFPLFFALLLLLFVSFVPLFRPSWLSRSFCFFLPFPSPFSCRCFSWLCSVLWLFACLGFRLAALPSRPRFALLFFLL